jgi:DNA-binding NtrC family response regulator
MRHVRGVSPTAMRCLQSYHWPGNVRELVNVVERAVSFCDVEIIQLDHLPEHLRTGEPGMPHTLGGDTFPEAEVPAGALSGDAPRPPRELVQVPFKDAKERWVSSFERDYIVSLLRRHSGNISHAAREADIDRKYFRKLMKKYDIDANTVVEEH